MYIKFSWRPRFFQFHEGNETKGDWTKGFTIISPKTIWDVCYMLFFNTFCLLLIRNLLGNNQNFMEQLLYSGMYIYWRREGNNMIHTFCISVQALYLPWIALVIAKISSLSITWILIGYSVGHFYYSLKYTLYEKLFIKILQTPRWFKWIILNMLGRFLGFRNKRLQQGWEVHSCPNKFNIKNQSW